MAQEGDNVSFRCDVHAWPAVTDIAWFLAGQHLVQQTAGVLTLDRVTREYDGVEVRCEARNTVGVGQDVVQLEIRCKFYMEHILY